MGIFFVLATFLFSANVFALEPEGTPYCRADLSDTIGVVVTEMEWQQDLFMGKIAGASVPVLISTSEGDNQVMSLWVREDVAGYPNGMFSFVDLSDGREHGMRLYMRDGFSVGVKCRWMAP